MTDGNVERSFTRASLYLSAGLLIWAAHFLLTYVFAALACARGFAGNTIAGIGVIAFVTLMSCLVAIGANAWVLRVGLTRYRSRELARERGTEDFIDFTAGAIATLSMVAIAWSGFTAAIAPGCR